MAKVVELWGHPAQARIAVAILCQFRCEEAMSFSRVFGVVSVRLVMSVIIYRRDGFSGGKR